MKTIRVEFPVPDDVDPSDLLEKMSETALDLWQDYFDLHQGQEDELHTFICNEVVIQELQ